MTTASPERAELENELRLALTRKELEIHFQPQVAVASRRIVGVEALPRWPHRDRGWIPPAQFIAIAEDSNLIHPLGEFVLARACRQIREWDRAGLPPLRTAVNVSAQQLRSEGFAQTVDGALRRAALAPRRVELDFGESVLVASRDQAITVLNELKAIGVQIAVSEFGMSYPNLDHVMRLPVDCLKIDRSIVWRVTEEGRDAMIAQAIISLARTLDLRVVAEGVETAAQLDFVLSHGCDEALGELFCEVLPPDALVPVLASGFASVSRGAP